MGRDTVGRLSLGRSRNVPTRKRFRHGRRRAFHLYHVRKRGEICFEDICSRKSQKSRTHKAVLVEEVEISGVARFSFRWAVVMDATTINLYLILLTSGCAIRDARFRRWIPRS